MPSTSNAFCSMQVAKYYYFRTFKLLMKIYQQKKFIRGLLFVKVYLEIEKMYCCIRYLYCSYDIMLQCWAMQPKERPSFTTLRDLLDDMLAQSVENSATYLDLNVDCFPGDNSNDR